MVILVLSLQEKNVHDKLIQDLANVVEASTINLVLLVLLLGLSVISMILRRTKPALAEHTPYFSILLVLGLLSFTTLTFLVVRDTRDALTQTRLLAK